MSSKKTTKRKTTSKTTRKKHSRSIASTIKRAVKKAVRKTAKKTARRRKTHTPKIATHGKTAAQRRKYIEYLGVKKKLINEFFK